jgi:hypothetical protein
MQPRKFATLRDAFLFRAKHHMEGVWHIHEELDAFYLVCYIDDVQHVLTVNNLITVAS